MISVLEFPNVLPDYAIVVRDIPVGIRDTVGFPIVDHAKYMTRARELYFNTPKKAKFMFPYNFAPNISTGVSNYVNIPFLTSDFIYYFDSLFPEITLRSNLLINDIGDSTGTKHLLGPEDIRKAKFEALNIGY